MEEDITARVEHLKQVYSSEDEFFFNEQGLEFDKDIVYIWDIDEIICKEISTSKCSFAC
jgi:hypothetical protein